MRIERKKFPSLRLSTRFQAGPLLTLTKCLSFTSKMRAGKGLVLEKKKRKLKNPRVQARSRGCPTLQPPNRVV